MRVAFIGLGAMGSRMGAVLAAAGHRVVGFDRNPEKTAGLIAAGGEAAEGVAAACAGAEALVLMVATAAQAEEALIAEGAAAALPAGALVLSSVTMPSADAERLGAAVEGGGRLFLDAPVSGGAGGAASGALTFMAAGSDAAFDRAAPLMAAMGRHVFRCGDRPGPGSTMKMAHQLAAGANLAVAAEVVSFGAHLGLDPARLLEVLGVSAGGSWMIADRGPRMLSATPEVKSAVDIFVKDLGIVLDAARAERFPVPVTAAALQVFLGASAAGYGGADDSQAVRFYERLGGRPVAANDS